MMNLVSLDFDRSLADNDDDDEKKNRKYVDRRLRVIR